MRITESPSGALVPCSGFCHCQVIVLALGWFLCLDWSPSGAGCVNFSLLWHLSECRAPPMAESPGALGCAFGGCFVLFSLSFLLTEHPHQPRAWQSPAGTSLPTFPRQWSPPGCVCAKAVPQAGAGMAQTGCDMCWVPGEPFQVSQGCFKEVLFF